MSGAINIYEERNVEMKNFNFEGKRFGHFC